MSKRLKSLAAAAAMLGATLTLSPNAAAHDIRGVLRQLTNTASVQQEGARDRAATAQAGAANDSAINQRGDDLTANVRQNGDANSATIHQVGRGNTGAITQNGSGNDACLVQVGRNVNGEIVQNGDNQSVGVLQTRRGSLAIPVSLCRSYDRHNNVMFVMRATQIAVIGNRQ